MTKKRVEGDIAALEAGTGESPICEVITMMKLLIIWIPCDIFTGGLDFW
jgi:hypothetical protein